MSIAQKYLATIATIAVAVAVVFSFVATIQVAQAATVCPHTFSTSLKMGMTSSEVMALQQFLNSDSATQVAATGAGSPGAESSYFGAKTKAAVMKFQDKYAADVLTPVGLTAGTGFFGASSRAKANMLCGGTVTTPGTTPATTGTGLAVAAGTQPGNSLAPQGTSRVPFTRFTLTAGNDGDVKVTGVTVQRTGLANDGAFAGVILIDEATGNQLGTSKTFNSNHQAIIGESMTVPRGTTKTFLVAANMAADESTHAGEAPSISVVGINTTATVSGSLPISGANQTINATLTTGSITVATSNSSASNSNQSPNIGDTGRKTTGLRLTAGSAEDLTVKWVRFNQTGSVSSTDLSNVVVNVGGTAYPLTVSADGKYYAASLGAGLVVAKGNQVDVYVSYDVTGSNSSGRTVIFDIDKNTDIFATGNTYGYGVSPVAPSSVSVPTSRGTITITSGTPYVYATQDTIVGASVTTISKATEVPAQNIAINVQNQPLGGFVVDLKGESLTVQSLAVTVASSSGSGTGVLTNVTLVNENGAVVSGPYDANSAGSTITFSSAITFPTGRHVYTIKGKVATAIGNGTVYTLSTTPSGWSSPKGDVSGNTITISQGAFSMNAMTVKAGAVSIGRASSPASQNLVPGGTSVLMANFQFDATQSGEDVRFATAKVRLHGAGTLTADESKLTSCQLFDGSTALNTGSNVLTPSSTTATSTDPFDSESITLDNPITVTKGAVKTLGMRCNISSTADNNSTFSWDVQDAASWTFTGATSGTSIGSPTDASDSAVVITVSSGSATVTTDPSSPGYTLASAGSSNVTVGALKLRSSNEDLNLSKLGLSLTNTASSSSGDLVKVSIYDGATKVGEAYFVGSATVATSTFTSSVTLTKDVDKTLTLKADLASVGTSQPVTFSGHLLAVDFLNAEGTGVSSGTTIYPSGSSAVSGVRISKSFPTLALDSSLGTTGLADGRLMRFKVTADAAGPVSLTEFNLTFATTSATLSNVNVYGYTDSSYSQPVSGLQSGGMFSTTDGVGTNWASASTVFEFTAYNGSASTTLQVPAGATRYFEVRGTAAGVISGSSITTTLKNGTAFVTCTTPAAAATNPLCKSTATGITNDFIWSPNSTTTPVRADLDWLGGYGIPGLPSNGLIQTRSN